MKSHQGLAFFHQDPGWDPKGQPKQYKGKCLAGRKTLTFVYWILRSPFKISFFPIRIQDGIPRDSQRDEKENVWHVRKKNKRLFIEFYEVLSGLHFFHQDPGWDPKGQPKGHTAKRLTYRKTLASFLLYFMKSYQDLAFSTRIQDGTPKDNQSNKKGNVLQAEKPWRFFTEI